jgi:wyosine [tRNA(Phe)-imidazoG37] synthetase (radical SAM superfamily)
VPVEEVYRELKDFFDNNSDPEYITFSGAGEPTLHSHIGEVLGFLKNLRPKIPLAVLTNGSLFSDSEVRKELMLADLVLPSLDAATDASFRRINRPARNFTIDEYIQGLIDFSKEFEGEIWMEVLFLPDYNDDVDNINALKEALLKIKLNRIQLNTLDRPGTVEGLRAATWAELERIVKHWDMEHVEIIAPVQYHQDVKSYRTDVESAILETIARRPCTLSDLGQILGLHINEINKYLGVMEDAGKLETVEQERGTFYQIR